MPSRRASTRWCQGSATSTGRECAGQPVCIAVTSASACGPGAAIISASLAPPRDPHFVEDERLCEQAPLDIDEAERGIDWEFPRQSTSLSGATCHASPCTSLVRHASTIVVRHRYHNSIEIVSAVESRRSALRRAQVDPQVGESFVVLRIALLIEDGEEVFLAWLAEGEPVESALPLETRFALLVST